MIDYVAYLKTPKNASTTLLNYLKKYKKIHFFYSLEEFEDSILMKDEKVFIFTTVRNPYTRSVSSWQHCLKESNSKKIIIDDHHRRIRVLHHSNNIITAVI